MCPGTLALAAAGMSAAGSLYQGIAAGNAASYQAEVARNNAVVERQNAGYAAGAGSAAITDAGLRARAASAGTRAALAANNVDVNSGSAVDTQVGQREMGNYDVANTANRAAKKVYGYQVAATDFQAQAGLDSSEATNDYVLGTLKAGSTLAGSPSFQQFAGNTFSSLMSGPPSLPGNYAWMKTNNDAGYTDIGFA